MGCNPLCMPTIHLSEENHKELGKLGTRDESWDIIVSRVLQHTDKEAILQDLRNQDREQENVDSPQNNMSQARSRRTKGISYSKRDGHPALRKLEDGTKVRHKFKKGEYAGEVVQGRVRDGHIVYNSKWMAPSTAAVEAVEDIKGESHRINGWRWWEYLDDESREWRSIDELRD